MTNEQIEVMLNRVHKKWSGSSSTAEFRNDIIALTR